MTTPKPDTTSPPLHYVGALVTTLLVTGLAFMVKEAAPRYMVLAVAIVMDLSVIAVAIKDLGRRR